VDPFRDDQIDCNGYTLRMGEIYYRTGEHEAGYEQKKTSLTSGESFLIPAGQFAFLLTKETVRIPADAMAFISMRTGIKFQGLINVSGFHVDPGYQGKLIYAVYNASPSAIQICEGDPIFKIWFSDLDAESKTPYLFDGKGLADITGEMIKGMNKEIYSLQSLAEKIREQQHAIDARFAAQQPVIDHLQMIWRTAIMGVIGAALLSFLAFALPSVFKLGELVASYWSQPSSKQSSVLSPQSNSPSAPITPSSANPPAAQQPGTATGR
jgi:dCTP deaminase